MRQASPAERHAPNIEWDAHPALRQLSMAGWLSTFADQRDDLDLVVHEACKVAVAVVDVVVRMRFAGRQRHRAQPTVGGGSGHEGRRPTQGVLRLDGAMIMKLYEPAIRRFNSGLWP